MLSLFLFAVVLLAIWFVAVMAFQVTVAWIHLLLVAALITFAIGFVRRMRPVRRDAAEQRPR